MSRAVIIYTSEAGWPDKAIRMRLVSEQSNGSRTRILA
jgi:hypothetical protein